MASHVFASLKLYGPELIPTDKTLQVVINALEHSMHANLSTSGVGSFRTWILEAAPIRISHDDLSTRLTHRHVGGVMIPVDIYFRLELDQRYIRLDHDILRLDHEFGLNMSRSETSFSVADPATISSSITLILAM